MWYVFENVGYLVIDIKEFVGVFIGIGGLVISYFVNWIGCIEWLLNMMGSIEYMGMDKDFVSIRIFYKLDLIGFSVNI